MYSYIGCIAQGNCKLVLPLGYGENPLSPTVLYELEENENKHFS